MGGRGRNQEKSYKNRPRLREHCLGAQHTRGLGRDLALRAGGDGWSVVRVRA